MRALPESHTGSPLLSFYRIWFDICLHHLDKTPQVSCISAKTCTDSPKTRNGVFLSFHLLVPILAVPKLSTAHTFRRCRCGVLIASQTHPSYKIEICHSCRSSSPRPFRLSQPPDTQTSTTTLRCCFSKPPCFFYDYTVVFAACCLCSALTNTASPILKIKRLEPTNRRRNRQTDLSTHPFKVRHVRLPGFLPFAISSTSP